MKMFSMSKATGTSIQTESRLFSDSNDYHQRRINKGGVANNAIFGCNLFFLVLLMVTSLLAIAPSTHGAQLPAKRAAELDPADRCQPTKPFRCPTSTPGNPLCISIQYLCDGAADCQDGYDEDPRLCTAAKRPPVEETLNFLQTLISNHGPNYLEKLFGPKARDALAPLGGVQQVAVALSESETLEDFGKALHLMRSDLEHLRNVFTAVESGDVSMLKSLGIRNSELTDVKFFLDKLVNTGFMD